MVAAAVALVLYQTPPLLQRHLQVCKVYLPLVLREYRRARSARDTQPAVSAVYCNHKQPFRKCPKSQATAGCLCK